MLALQATEAEITAKRAAARAASDLAEVYVVVESALRQLEEPFGLLNAISNKLKTESIPELFTENKTTSVTTLGYRVTISASARVGIRKGLKDEAIAWLEANEFGDIIDREPRVNASTLDAFGRAQLEEGNELPDDIFNVYVFNTTSLTKATRK